MSSPSGRLTDGGSSTNGYNGTAESAFAVKRLNRDLKELLIDQPTMTTISALPTQNMLEWHVNLRPDDGPYGGTIFHLILKFKTDYPHSPPRIQLCTSIIHPNVFDSWDVDGDGYPYVCLDMLKIHESGKPYAGWTPAYSVTSILLQLQSFLFGENIPQEGGYAVSARQYNSVFSSRVNRAIERARNFQCEVVAAGGEKVTHTHSNPWPPLPLPLQQAESNNLTQQRLGITSNYIEKEPGSWETVVRNAVTNSSSFSAGTTNSKREEYSSIYPSLGNNRFASFVDTDNADEDDSMDIVVPAMKKNETSTTLDSSGSVELPTAVLLNVFSFLHPTELSKVRDVSSKWRKIVIGYNLFERSQLSCFFTKSNLDDDQSVFGVGISVEYYPDGNLKSASSPLDVLSLEAFRDHGVRTGVFGKERFSFFQPLILNDGHARKAIPVAERTIFEIMRKVPPPPYSNYNRSAPSQRLYPDMILQLLSTLMNTMVVELMNEVTATTPATTPNPAVLLYDSDSDPGTDYDSGSDYSDTATYISGGNEMVKRHASERALEGYCAFHHLLLAFAKRYPSIKAMANKQVDEFISFEDSRHKKSTPDIGNLLCCLALSQNGWASLWKPLLLEVFDRNVRWILKDHPTMAITSVNYPDEATRLATTFEATATSRRLLMFQVYFMSTLGRPKDTKGPIDVLHRYNKRLGRPTTAAKEELQIACKEILAVATWEEFFKRCLVPVPPTNTLVSILKTAVMNSSMKGYHGSPWGHGGGRGRGRGTGQAGVNGRRRQHGRRGRDHIGRGGG